MERPADGERPGTGSAPARRPSRRGNTGPHFTLSAGPPVDPQMEYERARQNHRSGHLQSAVEGYERVLSAAPTHAGAWHLLGFAHLTASRFDRALECLERAVALRPDEGEFHHNLALALFALARGDDAARHWARARQAGYDDASSLYHLAADLVHQQRLEAAESTLRALIRTAPDLAEAHQLLGIVARRQERTDEAIRCYERAVELRPGLVEAWNNLGNLWRDTNQFERAVACYERALRTAPEFAACINNLGVAWARQGELDKAIEHYRRAAHIEPRSPEIRNNLGDAYREVGRYQEALRELELAIELDPNRAEIHSNLGVVLQQQEAHDRAIRAFQNAVERAADNSEVLDNLATAYQERGRLDEAARCYAEIARLQPDQPLWKLRQALVGPTVFSTREEMDAHWNALDTCVSSFTHRAAAVDLDQLTTVASQPPFRLQFLPGNLRPFKERFASVYASLGSALPECPVRRHGKPRIGFMVTSRHEGVFLKNMRGVLEKIDTNRFELVVFCGPIAVERIRRAVRRELRVVPLTRRFRQMAEQVRDAALDLLYFWEIGTDRANYFLPFLRLAPVQCTSWGHQVTSGIPQVDAYLSSHLIESEDAAGHYSESLMRLDTLPTYRERLDPPVAARTRDDFGLPAGSHVYLCPQQCGKFHPDFDALLAAILRRDEQACLVLLSDRQPHHAQRLLERLRRGMPDVAHRICGLPRLTRTDYLSLVALSDVMLDPPYFAGGNTTYDGFERGVPIVTCPSPHQRGRFTLGCYRKMDLEPFVAADSGEYVDQAVRLASEPDYRRHVSQLLLERCDALFDDSLAVAEHERVFSELIAARRGS